MHLWDALTQGGLEAIHITAIGSRENFDERKTLLRVLLPREKGQKSQDWFENAVTFPWASGGLRIPFAAFSALAERDWADTELEDLLRKAFLTADAPFTSATRRLDASVNASDCIAASLSNTNTKIFPKRVRHPSAKYLIGILSEPAGQVTNARGIGSATPNATPTAPRSRTILAACGCFCQSLSKACAAQDDPRRARPQAYPTKAAE